MKADQIPLADIPPERWTGTELAQAFQTECRELFGNNPYKPLKDEDHRFHGKYNRIRVHMGKGFSVVVRRTRLTPEERKKINPETEGFTLQLCVTGGREIEAKYTDVLVGIEPLSDEPFSMYGWKAGQRIGQNPDKAHIKITPKWTAFLIDLGRDMHGHIENARARKVLHSSERTVDETVEEASYYEDLQSGPAFEE